MLWVLNGCSGHGKFRALSTLAETAGPQCVVGMDHRFQGVFVLARAAVGIGMEAFNQGLVLGLGLFCRGIFVQSQGVQRLDFILAQASAQFGIHIVCGLR